MDIQNVVSMMGAIAIFLFGMSTMTDGLAQLSSGRLESILEKLTDNVFKGILLGALVTAIIHSSATTTVMCVGFVNAGIMKLEQTVGIIMGANIGTTFTAQILRLASVSGDNPILFLLQPSVLGPVLAVLGIILYMFIKGGKKRNIGQIIIGMGMLFIGMNTMTTAVAPLQDEPWLKSLFTAFSNPVLGMLVGAVITALLQSSTAFTGILQALSTTGVVRFNTAIPLIMGQNIGTTLTALLSSAGASKNAKRTALIHLFFNVIGSVFFLVVLYVGNALFRFSFWTEVMDMGSVANFHLVFNVVCTLLFLPFYKMLVRLAERLVPGDTDSRDLSVLDERFLSSPSLALQKARETVVHMGHLAKENYERSLALINKYDEKIAEQFKEDEASLDKLEVMLDNYLVQLTDRALTTEESMRVSELLHTLSDFERIGDYADNIRECAVALHQKNAVFSEDAKQELKALSDAVDEALDLTVRSYDSRVRSLAIQVEPLEEVVDLMRDAMRDRHVERLKNNECTVELGLQFLELIINLERISDHCSAVAMFVVRETAPAHDLSREDSHAYLHQLHHSDAPEYTQAFAAYKKKYFETIQ